MKFSGSGVFKHTYENSNQIPQLEERVVLLEAASFEIATQLILEEFSAYACEGIEFLNVYKIDELDEDPAPIIEVSSSMKVFSGSGQQYIERFWLDQRPDSCATVGWQHVWYNSGDGNSSCYNCNEEKAGELWKAQK